MSRKRIAGFTAMVHKIGRRKAAGRFGVSERTVAKWIKDGIPAKRDRDVASAVSRHERAVRAAEVSKVYRDLGWTRFKNFSEVDEFIGTPEGHTRSRWLYRKKWWREHRPDERLPKKVAVVQDRLGRLLYVNGDAIVWRGYTIDGRLFWTLAENLEGYDTPEQMQEVYEALLGRSVVLTWGQS